MAKASAPPEFSVETRIVALEGIIAQLMELLDVQTCQGCPRVIPTQEGPTAFDGTCVSCLPAALDDAGEDQLRRVAAWLLTFYGPMVDQVEAWPDADAVRAILHEHPLVKELTTIGGIPLVE